MSILDELDRSRERVLAALESLPDEALLAKGTVGDLSIADVLALQAAWEAELVTGLMRLDQGVKPENLLAALAQPEEYEAGRLAEYVGRDLDPIFDDWQLVRVKLEGWLEMFSDRDLTNRKRFKHLKGKSLKELILSVSVGREGRYVTDLEKLAHEWG
ncbi:MAG: DinB family protein [Chloroflexi bacterium]|nr:DinB family protein [Chloroflexota bacterium]